MKLGQERPIATLADAIAAAEFALNHTPEGCPSLVMPYALRLLIEAAAQENTRAPE